MKKKYLAIIFVFALFQVRSQERQFWNEIEAFKKQDSLRFPPKRAILFVGSSTFRVWNDLQNDFPRHRVINRGFGGSGLQHLTEYVDEIIYPYKPKQIVIYCGENDFFQGENITPDTVLMRFKKFFGLIRDKFPRTHIAYISLKPSPRRQALMPQMEKTNALVQDFLRRERRTSFISIYQEMIDAQGNPKKELFTEDNLHMNRNGYLLWKKEILPYLKRTKRPDL